MVIHCQQNVDCALINVQLHDLFKFLLADLADTCLDLGNFPDQDLTIGGTSDGFLGARQEDSLCVGLLLRSAAVLARRCTVVLESLRLVGPLHEEDAASTVASKLVWVHRIELDPVGSSDGLVVELHGDLGTVLVHVRPVPQRAGLGFVGAQSCNVAVVS